MPTSRLRFLFVSAGILCLALAVRLTDLYNIPISFDEGDHLIWAQRFSTGDTTYPIFMDGKFLLGVTLAQFKVLGPSPLWLARAVVGLLSIGSCAACIAMGKLVGAPKVGMLAGLLYAVLPQAVFFERQTFADPLMASAGMVAAVLTLMLAKTQGMRFAAPLAAALAASFLFKFLGGLYVIFPACAVLLAPRTWKERWQLAARNAVAGIAAAALVGVFIVTLRSRLGYNDLKLASQQIGFIGCPAIVCQRDLAAQLRNLHQFGAGLLNTIPPYVGWPIALLAIAAWPLTQLRVNRNAAKSNDARGAQASLNVTALAAVGMLVAFAFVAKGIVPPRYLSFMLGPLCVLAAVGLIAVPASWAQGILLLAITAWPMANSVPLIFKFEQAALANIDRQTYSAGWVGPGVRDAAFALRNREAASPQPPVVVVGNIYLHLVGAYFDRMQVDVRESEKATPADIGRWLLDGRAIYFFDDLNTGGADLAGLITTEIGRYPIAPVQGENVIRLRKVIGIDAQLRDRIFANVFVDPRKLPDDYAALAASLTPDSLLLAYPPNQTVKLPSARAVGNNWPLDTNAVANELAAVTAGRAEITAVFLEETRGDPDRFIETWLTSHLFRIGETWFGPLRLVEFAGGGQSSQTITVGARFGDAIVLESVEVLDSVAKQGGVFRIRLNWRTLAPVAESFKVFVHVFSGNEIVAQHDGQPVGELRPTTMWQTGESVADQFAIRLPNVTPPGVYQLRIGLYDLNTQARAPVMFTDGNGGEFYVGGHITIK